MGVRTSFPISLGWTNFMKKEKKVAHLCGNVLCCVLIVKG